jgi:DNA-binding XRE family transcriptional regulator
LTPLSGCNYITSVANRQYKWQKAIDTRPYVLVKFCYNLGERIKGVWGMQPNRDYIVELMRKKNWSQNKLAMKAGVSNTTISRWINGQRGAGSELISGIIKAFPKESINNLFIL